MTRNQPNPSRPKAPAVRCAVYTRKSSEEGLEQEFNSFDAQRESGEAYIASQKNEGWTCLPDRYDDGGFTGGNMDHAPRACGRVRRRARVHRYQLELSRQCAAVRSSNPSPRAPARGPRRWHGSRPSRNVGTRYALRPGQPCRHHRAHAGRVPGRAYPKPCSRSPNGQGEGGQ